MIRDGDVDVEMTHVTNKKSAAEKPLTFRDVLDLALVTEALSKSPAS